jgi:aspartate/methionine/tyrosine aminotransferase
MAGSGVKQLMFNAFAATVGEGDEVILPRPF